MFVISLNPIHSINITMATLMLTYYVSVINTNGWKDRGGMEHIKTGHIWKFRAQKEMENNKGNQTWVTASKM
jgi:hypothetical protein